MKNSTLLVLAFCFLIVDLKAQPPVINSQYLPVLGKFFSGRNFYRTQAWPVTTGPNSNWDFTGLQANYITDYSFAFRNKPTTGTQGQSLFPGADMTQMSYFGSDSIENFIKVNNGQLNKMGYKYKGWDGNEIFTPHRPDIKSGMEYEDVSITLVQSVRNIVGNLLYYKIYDTISYAGYGNMTTTFATYNNVPLFTRRTATWVANQETGPFTREELIRQWNWYLPGFGAPFIQYSETINMFTPEQVIYEGYIGFIPQVSINQSLKKENIRIFPTSIGHESFLTVNGVPPQCQIQILDAMGRTVLSGVMKDQLISIPDLPSGVHTLRVFSGHDIFQTRFVKQ